MNNIIKYIFSILVLSMIACNIKLNCFESYAISSPTLTLDENTGKPSITESDGTALKNKTETLNEVLKQSRLVVVFLSGLASLTVIGLFIINFINLGNSRGNPQERQKAINGLIVCGIATAGLGSITLISKLFFNMIK